MTTPPAADAAFESLLEFVRDERGFDFTGYKRSTLVPPGEAAHGRGGDRGRLRGLPGDYLEAHPDEFASLFNTILINVTSFFRDPEAWESLAREFIPRHPGAQAAGEPIRVWSAGCASGEETYTLAMVLAEALGRERFHEQVKIYATDVDEEALAAGRARPPTPSATWRRCPPALREQYFEPAGRPLRLPRRPAPRGHLRPARPGAATRRSRTSTCWSAATR